MISFFFCIEFFAYVYFFYSHFLFVHCMSCIFLIIYGSLFLPSYLFSNDLFLCLSIHLFFVHCMSCIRSSYLRTPFLAFHLFLLIYLSIYLFVLLFLIYLSMYLLLMYLPFIVFFNQHLDVLFSYCCPLGLQEYKYIYTN